MSISYFNCHYTSLHATNARPEQEPIALILLRATAQVYEALLDWVRHDVTHRGHHMRTLLSLVRLPLVSPLFLFETISKEAFVRGNLEARDLLEEAIYYHLLPEKRAAMKAFSVRPRCAHDAFGLIYAVGALSNSAGCLSTVEVYDCLQDRWRLAESMVTSRSRVSRFIANCAEFIDMASFFFYWIFFCICLSRNGSLNIK